MDSADFPHNVNVCIPAWHPWEEAAICSLGCSTPTRVEDPLGPGGADSATPKLMATSSQALQCATTSDDILTTIPISHSPFPPPTSKTPTVASIPSTPWSEDHPRADPGALSEEVLWLQREMNMAMGWLLTTRVSMDSHQRRLVSNTKTAMHQNEAKTAMAIKEAKACCTATIREAEAAGAGSHPYLATIPWRKYARLGAWGHRERRVGSPFFSGGLQSGSRSLSPQSPWDTHVPLAVANWEHVPSHPFGDHPQLATAIRNSTPTTPPPTISETPTPPTGTKWWCYLSNREVASLRSGE